MLMYLKYHCIYHNILLKLGEKMECKDKTFVISSESVSIFAFPVISWL